MLTNVKMLKNSWKQDYLFGDRVWEFKRVPQLGMDGNVGCISLKLANRSFNSPISR